MARFSKSHAERASVPALASEGSVTPWGSAASLEVEHLRDRVQLYLRVLLSIDIGCFFAGKVFRLLLSPAKVEADWAADSTIWALAVTLVLGVAWALAKLRHLARAPLIALESSAAIAHGFVFIPLVRQGIDEVNLSPALGPAFILLGVLLGLVLRASLVPSAVGRTIAVGVASIAGMYLAERRSVGASWLALMGCCFVAATAVTSHVIYGLRRQVRAAMRLSQYTLEEKLGEGGMGEVYRASHSRLRRATAIKLLPASRSSQQAVARFEAEVQLTAGLTHPNTITIFDYGRTEDGVFYYAMEYLLGATLEQIVAVDGPQPPARVIKVLVQAAGALQEAHAVGLIHRDIKPANIMLTRQGLDADSVKVLDFGLVRPFKNSAGGHLTADGALVGTPLYMAPEVISAPQTAGPASDLYALAAVAYFLLTGVHLFRGATLIEVCLHHLHTPPESISARLGAGVPDDLEGVIMACLSKRIADRPVSAAALISRLAQCKDYGQWNERDAEAWWTRCRDALESCKAERGSKRRERPATLPVMTLPSPSRAETWSAPS